MYGSIPLFPHTLSWCTEGQLRLHAEPNSGLEQVVKMKLLWFKGFNFDRALERIKCGTISRKRGSIVNAKEKLIQCLKTQQNALHFNTNMCCLTWG